MKGSEKQMKNATSIFGFFARTLKIVGDGSTTQRGEMLSITNAGDSSEVVTRRRLVEKLRETDQKNANSRNSKMHEEKANDSNNNICVDEVRGSESLRGGIAFRLRGRLTSTRTIAEEQSIQRLLKRHGII